MGASGGMGGHEVQGVHCGRWGRCCRGDAWGVGAAGQASRTTRRIGVLNGFDNVISNSLRMTPFKKELEALSWIEGRNIQIDYQEVPNLAELDAAAVALVSSQPEVILVMPTPAIEAIRRATQSIPVVFANTVEPVEGGFVTSISRAGGNVTGFTSMEYSVGGKWLELLKEFAPATSRVLVLYVHENYTSRGLLRAIQVAAPSFGVQITAAPVRDADDITRAFASFGAGASGGLLTPPHPIHQQSQPTYLPTCDRVPAACGVSVSPIRGRWRTGIVRSVGSRRVSTRCWIR